MIITLKGADFSASNIGVVEVNVWKISRTLGDGATYSGPSTVEKGGKLSATVTVDSAYDIGEVVVTMDGATVTSAHTINGNVVNINIAEVTGTVVIRVDTIGQLDAPEISLVEV